jgi:hypothetical protein
LGSLLCSTPFFDFLPLSLEFYLDFLLSFVPFSSPDRSPCNCRSPLKVWKVSSCSTRFSTFTPFLEFYLDFLLFSVPFSSPDGSPSTADSLWEFSKSRACSTPFFRLFTPFLDFTSIFFFSPYLFPTLIGPLELPFPSESYESRGLTPFLSTLIPFPRVFPFMISHFISGSSSFY